MGQITIRNIDDAVLQALRRRAAAAGRSMEEEAQRLLALVTAIDRDAARARLQAVRSLLGRHPDFATGELVREMRDERTRKLAD